MDKTEHILQEIEHSGLLKPVIHQLNKDFRFANIDQGFHADIPASSLKLLLYSILRDLVDNNCSDLQNLLYAVDVSEKRLQSEVVSSAEEQVQEILFLILEREFKKVTYRKRYS